MVRQPATVRSDRRRNVLRLLGATAAGGLVAVRAGAQEEEEGDAERDDSGAGDGTDRAMDDDLQFHLRQGDECVPLTPLSGNQPVEEFYEYAYPRDDLEGPPGVVGTSYSSEGTVDLQQDRGSVLFLYDGPEGLSLVVVHGRRDEAEADRPAGESDAGGTVSFALTGLPDDGQWVVLDDYYAVDGEQSETNYDRYEFDDDRHVLHWTYRGGRTDGGVFRGLESGADVELDPAFNDAAGLAEDHDYGTVETWEALSGDLDDPDRLSLELDRPLQLSTGDCPAAADGPE